MNNKEKGFTLVEIAIVMIVIGLIIGGLLIGRSMIKTAQVASFVKQIQQFDVAITNFRQKYGALPGDSSALPVAGGRGFGQGGNAFIEDSYGNSYGIADLYDGEEASFFPQLQAAGFYEGKGTMTATVTGNFKTSGSSPNSPGFSLGRNSGVTIFHDNGGQTYYVGSTPGYYPRGKHYYMIADYSLMTPADLYTGMFQNSISGRDALAVDTKMDDGLALGPYGTYGVPTTGPTNKFVFDVEQGGSCSAGTKYILTSGSLCTIAVRMQAINYGDADSP